MNIYDALEQVKNWKRRDYFKWKHDIRYDQTKPKKSEEDFKRYVNVKTLNSFLEWEKSPEYHSLCLLLLQSKLANDLMDTYQIVSEKARSGDEKSVKLFLQLSKEISAGAKAAYANVQHEQEEEDDDLEL